LNLFALAGLKFESRMKASISLLGITVRPRASVSTLSCPVLPQRRTVALLTPSRWAAWGQ
jgi:hypothetical protein